MRLKSNTQHLTGLINDLLDLSKIEAGKIELKPTRVSLGGLVHEVVETFRPVAAEKPIALEVATPEPAILVWADRDKLTQVLLNLIDNAIKFTPANGRVTVYTEGNDKEWVRVSVNDTGPGIAVEETEKIFDKFYQAAETGERNPKAQASVLRFARPLWSCMAEGSGSSLNRVAAAFLILHCQRQNRDKRNCQPCGHRRSVDRR